MRPLPPHAGSLPLTDITNGEEEGGDLATVTYLHWPSVPDMYKNKGDI